MSEWVLVAEDDPPMQRALKVCLEKAGYSVEAAGDGSNALRLAALRPFDAILLDLGLPDVNGLDVCAQLRQWTNTPIVIVSASSSHQDKIAILDAGADQYLEKPFVPEELLAHLRAVIRRATAASTPDRALLRFADIEVDLALREVRRNGTAIHLTPHEYGVLRDLARRPGAVVTSADLLRSVWGLAYERETHYLWVCIRHIRQKLEDEPSHPRYLVTVPRVGYRLRISERCAQDGGVAETGVAG